MKKRNEDQGRLDLYLEVTNKIVDLLESQKLTWDRPWITIGRGGKSAHNAFSSRKYSGINQILLSIRQMNAGYPYSGWLTFRQISSTGGRVKTGEKATHIIYWHVIFYDQNGEKYELEDVQSLSEGEKVHLNFSKQAFLRYYNVFNIAQSTGLPEELYEIGKLKNLEAFEKDERAESLIKSTDAHFDNSLGNLACYDSIKDVIYLPERKQFKGKESYYQTALHEIAHWTGHESRLNRSLANVFGTPEYAKEELIAELCSAFLCAELGVTAYITNNAAYVQDWIQVLNNDSRYIFQAVSKAKEAVFFIKPT